MDKNSSDGAWRAEERPAGRLKRLLLVLRPGHSHTAYTATVLLMVSAMLSRLMGLVRVKYIALVFGRGMEADALNAAEGPGN